MFKLITAGDDRQAAAWTGIGAQLIRRGRAVAVAKLEDGVKDYVQDGWPERVPFYTRSRPNSFTLGREGGLCESGKTDGLRKDTHGARGRHVRTKVTERRGGWGTLFMERLTDGRGQLGWVQHSNWTPVIMLSPRK